MMMATTIMRTSSLRMWVSSWASTASISASVSVSRNAVVTVMAYWPSLMPVAKAFSAGSSRISSCGTAIPREMQRFSRRL